MEPFVHDAVQDMHMARDQLLAVLDEVGPGDWGRFVPYGARTLHDLVAHVAGADQVWALTAKGLLKGEEDHRPPLTPSEARQAGERALARGRAMAIDELRRLMDERRRLLLALFELLEPRHLSLRLPSFGEGQNSVRERIWLGYHDRLHADDVRRALASRWHPPKLTFLPELHDAVAALAPGPALYVIYSVNPVHWERPVAENPSWTYKQLLAHIATGDWVLQTHLRHILEHGRPAGWPDVAAGNAERLAARDRISERLLVDEYLSMRHETMLLVSRLTRDHLALPIEFWWEPRPNRHTVLDYLTMFERHDRTHREQLRPAMKHATNPRG